VGPHQLRDAEVGDFHPAGGVQEDVLRLDVTVQNPVVMSELESLADRGYERQGLGRGHPCIAECLSEGHSIDVFEEQVAELPGLTEVIDSHYPRMVESGEQSGLALETFNEGGVTDQVSRQDLQGHPSVQRSLSGLEHHAHASRSEALHHFEHRKGGLDFIKAGFRSDAAQSERLRGLCDPLEHAVRAKLPGSIRRDGSAALGAAGGGKLGSGFRFHDTGFLRTISVTVTGNIRSRSARDE
jgi:hypothetical protein